jgi:3-oxoadipate enol-lactonase
MPHFQRADGPSLHYVIDDYTDSWKDAPYLLLQHGNGRSGAFWRSWVPYLSRYYKVVRPDVRGLGGSSAEFDLETEFTLDACVDDLIQLIDHLGVESLHFCGESMGGMLGIALAALHPRRMRTLTLVSTPVYMSNEVKKTYAVGHGSRIEAFKTLGRDAWIDATNRSTRFPPDADPGLLSWYKQEFAKNRAEVQLAMADIVSSATVAEFLPRLQLPVLGLYPTSGPITGAEQEQLLVERIENLELVHLPSSFHKIQLTHPAACAGHLLRFISNHDGRPCTES